MKASGQLVLKSCYAISEGSLFFKEILPFRSAESNCEILDVCFQGFPKSPGGRYCVFKSEMFVQKVSDSVNEVLIFQQGVVKFPNSRPMSDKV